MEQNSDASQNMHSCELSTALSTANKLSGSTYLISDNDDSFIINLFVHFIKEKKCFYVNYIDIEDNIKYYIFRNCNYILDLFENSITKDKNLLPILYKLKCTINNNDSGYQSIKLNSDDYIILDRIIQAIQNYKESSISLHDKYTISLYDRYIFFQILYLHFSEYVIYT